VLWNGTTVLGVNLDSFSNGYAQQSTVGDMACSNGSDFHCHGTTTVSSSSCNLCSAPSSLTSPTELGHATLEPLRELPERFRPGGGWRSKLERGTGLGLEETAGSDLF
jgi:hypothetical protein